MAGTITHKWNGTVLTVTSDSGTSSCDLKGSQGDMGVRGPQGAPGVLVDTSGTILAPANNYYLKEEVDDAIAASKKEASDNITTLQTSVESDILELQNTASAHSKRITNLEHTLAPTFFETDDSSAYMKDVPETALPYAEVNEIGGMSYKCENLLNMSALDGKTVSGITFTKNSNGTYTANGTSTATSAIQIHLANIAANNTETIWLSGGGNGVQLTVNAMQDNTFVQNIGTVNGGTAKLISNVTYNKIAVYLVINTGVTISNYTFYGMLNKGETALPFQPYFTGLRDSKVTAIESEGTNIFGGIKLANRIKEVAPTAVLNTTDKTITYYSGNTHQKTLFTHFKPNTQYTIIIKGKEAIGGFSNLGIVYTDGEVDQNSLKGLGTSSANTLRVVTASGKSIKELRGYWHDGTTTLYYEECGIFEGNVATGDFAPYVKHTFPTPEAVQALEGYGLGVNENYYNKVVIDPDNFIKKYVKNVKKIKLKDISWRQNGSRFYGEPIGMGAIKRTASITEIPNMVVEKYTPTGSYYVVGEGTKTDKTICEYQGYLYIYDTSYSTVDAFLTALGDAEIVYELATPTETDISDIVPDDNFIRVYGAGTVTAVNEYSQDVPTKITYQFKEATI